MDFDLAWCPACDRQIEPARRTVSVPVVVHPQQPPPPPPSSPRRTKSAVRQKTGLVNGTGRLRPNGTVKPPSPPQPTVVMKQRIVIDQGPGPLYCSPECQQADIDSRRREEPETESDASSDSLASPPPPPAPLTSYDKYAAMHNFPPTPPIPVLDDEPDYTYPVPEYNTGIIMAGRLLSALCPPPPKPHVGRYPPPREPHKVIPGWTDGSNEWRKALYSTAPAPKLARDPYGRESAAKAARPRPIRASSFACAPTTSVSNSTATAASFRSASDHMISKFSENFARRSESRTNMYPGGGASTSPVPSSAGSSCSLPVRRERPLVHPDAEGKLAVPNVKLKVRSGSSTSISSTWTSSAPGSTNSRRSARSPLSVTSDSDEDTERCPSKAHSFRDDPIFPTLTNARPVETTRSWSYDNVKTYPIMPMPVKKVKKMEKQIVDGEEVMVEVEVEEKPKRLFLFAPTRILTP